MRSNVPTKKGEQAFASETLLYVSFRYCGGGNTYQELVRVLSKSVAHAPGLIWKTWLINECEAEAGGLYLFTDGSALQGYLEDAVKASLEGQDIRDISIKTFETLNEIPLIALKRWRGGHGSLGR